MNTIQVIDLSIEEFKKIIKDSVEQNRSEIPLKEVKEARAKYATRKEAAAELHVSLPTLSDKISRGEIPAYRFGGRVLLKWEDIDNALKKIETREYPRAQ